MSARTDLRHLWRTRREHGFPWPFRWFGGGVTPWLTGYWRFSPVPFWRQCLGIPFRPYRYLRSVRTIARVRNTFFSPNLYDDVS